MYAPVGRSELGRFALDVAARALTFMNSYFGLPFPLPKLDLVAVPDFAAGAMENWGLITFREALVLVDAMQTPLETKTRVARVVCHEITHSWFGNFVTMEWWTHLWCNEGTTRFFEFNAMNYLFPEWNMWDQFVSAIFNEALRLDAMANSHAVEVDVNHPAEISEIFDLISYAYVPFCVFV